MGIEFFAPACPEPSASYQRGIDQGHAGLTTALCDVVKAMPSDFLKTLILELDECALSNSPSPLVERIFQRAICVYQAEQLLDARQVSDASQSGMIANDAARPQSTDVVTRRAG